MNPASARTLLWSSGLLLVVSSLGMAPAGAFFAAFLSAILAAIPLLFASRRLRIFAVILLSMALIAGSFHYPAYKEHMANYRHHAEKHR